ncbi:MAG: GFA family protein [Candidatus Binataceae bacterium]
MATGKTKSKIAKISGGCLCGAVRYEASVAPAGAAYCHCRMCQRSVGSVFGIFAGFPVASFRFTRGRPKRYQSSPIAHRGFCARCGSPLTCESIEHAESIQVTIGSLDDPGRVAPDAHWGVESQVEWYKPGDKLPRHKTIESPRVAKVAAKVRDGKLLSARNA